MDGERYYGNLLHSILEIGITIRLGINVYVRSKLNRENRRKCYWTPNIVLNIPRKHVYSVIFGFLVVSANSDNSRNLSLLSSDMYIYLRYQNQAFS